MSSPLLPPPSPTYGRFLPLPRLSPAHVGASNASLTPPSPLPGRLLTPCSPRPHPFITPPSPWLTTPSHLLHFSEISLTPPSPLPLPSLSSLTSSHASLSPPSLPCPSLIPPSPIHELSLTPVSPLSHPSLTYLSPLPHLSLTPWHPWLAEALEVASALRRGGVVPSSNSRGHAPQRGLVGRPLPPSTSSFTPSLHILLPLPLAPNSPIHIPLSLLFPSSSFPPSPSLFLPSCAILPLRSSLGLQVELPTPLLRWRLPTALPPGPPGRLAMPLGTLFLAWRSVSLRSASVPGSSCPGAALLARGAP